MSATAHSNAACFAPARAARDLYRLLMVCCCKPQLSSADLSRPNPLRLWGPPAGSNTAEIVEQQEECVCFNAAAACTHATALLQV
jgi:hypothetical protein